MSVCVEDPASCHECPVGRVAQSLERQRPTYLAYVKSDIAIYFFLASIQARSSRRLCSKRARWTKWMHVPHNCVLWLLKRKALSNQ